MKFEVIIPSMLRLLCFGQWMCNKLFAYFALVFKRKRKIQNSKQVFRIPLFWLNLINNKCSCLDSAAISGMQITKRVRSYLVYRLNELGALEQCLEWVKSVFANRGLRDTIQGIHKSASIGLNSKFKLQFFTFYFSGPVKTFIF